MAGPTCGQLLADMGADVVKVERLEINGDGIRNTAPCETRHFVSDCSAAPAAGALPRWRPGWLAGVTWGSLWVYYGSKLIVL